LNIQIIDAKSRDNLIKGYNHKSDPEMVVVVTRLVFRFLFSYSVVRGAVWSLSLPLGG
jgi:hypothetical protein